MATDKEIQEYFGLTSNQFAREGPDYLRFKYAEQKKHGTGRFAGNQPVDNLMPGPPITGPNKTGPDPPLDGGFRPPMGKAAHPTGFQAPGMPTTAGDDEITARRKLQIDNMAGGGPQNGDPMPKPLVTDSTETPVPVGQTETDDLPGGITPGPTRRPTRRPQRPPIRPPRPPSETPQRDAPQLDWGGVDQNDLFRRLFGGQPDRNQGAGAPGDERQDLVTRSGPPGNRGPNAGAAFQGPPGSRSRWGRQRQATRRADRTDLHRPESTIPRPATITFQGQEAAVLLPLALR